MKIFLAAIFFTFVSTFIQAQDHTKEQLDSLYEKFVWLRTDNKDRSDKLVEIDPSDRKCGFGIVSEIKHNFYSFTPEQQSVLAKILQRPTRDTSIVSPSGFFRIHYNSTGFEAPNYNPLLTVAQNAIQVALAADSSYNFEVNFLEYPPPPSDNGDGGDNLYDVYIIEYGGHFYGETVPESSIGEGKYTSYIMIDNDYSGYFTQGLNGAKVTVAHEFHHTIQVGNYTGDKVNIDRYFYEITSTSMEEFVYDNVNDYYNYLRTYFNNPGRAFALNDGYNLAHWNIFLKDKFGYNIIKRQWELLPQMRALNAIVTSLNEAGSTFGSKFNEFGVWTFFTNYRTITGKYFEEAAYYPLIRSINTIDFNSQPVNGEAKPTSNNFITFINSTDTLVAIISNTDYISGVNDINGNFDYQYILSASSIDGSTKLTDNYFAKLNVDQPGFWAIGEILNNQIVRQDSTIFPVLQKEELFVYPNPFFYNKSYDWIKILIDSKGESEADLNVYTSAMELVYSSKISFDPTRRYVEWKDIHNLELASGVYIFAIKLGDETTKGKLVIFNE